LQTSWNWLAGVCWKRIKLNLQFQEKQAFSPNFQQPKQENLQATIITLLKILDYTGDSKK
jgi:hypothetical protein